MNDAIDLIQNQAHEDANIIVGLVHDASLDDEVRITVIATGVGDRVAERAHGRMEAPVRRSGEERDRMHEDPRGARPARGRLIDDSMDDEIPAQETPSSRRRPQTDVIQASQEDFAFEDVIEDSRGESIDIPTYLRRWRNRGSRTRA
jgi:cell division protein FtsZ